MLLLVINDGLCSSAIGDPTLFTGRKLLTSLNSVSYLCHRYMLFTGTLSLANGSGVTIQCTRTPLAEEKSWTVSLGLFMWLCF